MPNEVRVVMVFIVKHRDECNGDLDEFAEQCAGWVKEDPAGWILSRPVEERFATSVSATVNDLL